MIRFNIEMNVGQEQRRVEADTVSFEGEWMNFYRLPPQGGRMEYWRVKIDCIVCMETIR